MMGRTHPAPDACIAKSEFFALIASAAQKINLMSGARYVPIATRKSETRSTGTTASTSKQGGWRSTMRVNVGIVTCQKALV